MDPRGVKKRPRSSTPTSGKGTVGGGGGETRKKKGSKKKDKNKKPRSDSAINNETTTSQEKHRHHKDTATADGHMMAQMLSTFSSLEQSRFQAYKRSSFAADAIEAWVAACLQFRYGSVGGGGGGDGVSGAQLQRPLCDLVAPGQAQDIGLVVAIAAKIYAQRLVAEAVTLQEKEKQEQISRQVTQPTNAAAEGGDGSSRFVPTTSVRNVGGESGTALQCKAVWKAVQERRRRGVDPGFFLQPAEDRWNWAAQTSTLKHYDVRRLAAMAAEDEYDQRRRREDSEPKSDDDEEGEVHDDGMDVEIAAPTEDSLPLPKQQQGEGPKLDTANDETGNDTHNNERSSKDSKNEPMDAL